jgi:hypothetical protein
MVRTASLAVGLVGAVLAANIALAQEVVSARSGLIHYSEGKAFVTGEQVRLVAGKFPEVREGKILHTEDGRVEVLLNTGTFLRMAENSTMKMISNKLSDTHVEMQRGTALVEVLETAKDNQVTIHVGGAAIQPSKFGLYYIDAEARELKVYDGQAAVSLNSSRFKAGRGHSVRLAPALQAGKFDRKKTDALYAFTQRRSAVIAQANMSASFSAAQGGSRTSRNSVWAWYPSLGMFTFLPGNGRIHSPFGYYYYSPVYMYLTVINPPRIAMPDYGGAGADTAWAGRASSASPSAPAAVAASTGDIGRSAPAPSAPPPSAGGGRSR